MTDQELVAKAIARDFGTASELARFLGYQSPSQIYRVIHHNKALGNMARRKLQERIEQSPPAPVAFAFRLQDEGGGKGSLLLGMASGGDLEIPLIQQDGRWVVHPVFDIFYGGGKQG